MQAQVEVKTLRHQEGTATSTENLPFKMELIENAIDGIIIVWIHTGQDDDNIVIRKTIGSSDEAKEYSIPSSKGFFSDSGLRYGFNYEYSVNISSASGSSAAVFELTKGIPFEEAVLVPGGTQFNKEVKRDSSTIATMLAYKFEVTNGQYREFCDQTGKSYPPRAPFSNVRNYFESQQDYPVVNVSWYDAAEYCNWRSRILGMKECYDEKYNIVDGADGYRLPAENEWFWIAAGVQSNIEESSIKKGNYRTQGNISDDKYTMRVGISNSMNSVGLYDLFGNVWEWCNDIYIPKSISTANSPMIGQTSQNLRLVCGGSWADDANEDWLHKGAYNEPQNKYSTIGFRPIRIISERI
ncbi:MAG: formylglycine-generating enzyme family protein [candidate division Zixibacteria bacterium]|nr:formylglycine-generating enzyme family protein [candidate division Zixibacteria bacterium]